MKFLTAFLAMVAAFSGSAFAAEGSYLYRAEMVQAAPGKLLELIDLYGEARAASTTGDAAPLLMRHSQGDRWDLLVIYPMESYSAYYSRERMERRQGVKP